MGIKELLNSNGKASLQISLLSYQGSHINDDKEMSNTFDDFFSNVGPNLDNEIPRPPPDKPLRNPEIYLKFRIPHNFLISATTQQEVNEIIIVCFFNLFIH